MRNFYKEVVSISFSLFYIHVCSVRNVEPFRNQSHLDYFSTKRELIPVMLTFSLSPVTFVTILIKVLWLTVIYLPQTLSNRWYFFLFTLISCAIYCLLFTALHDVFSKCWSKHFHSIAQTKYEQFTRTINLMHHKNIQGIGKTTFFIDS